MKNEDLKKVLTQIKKYNLAKVFKDEKELKSWLSKLNDVQIHNFIHLNIDLNEIEFPVRMLTNENLLNCSDYAKRIEAISKLKNGEGCWHLFDELCNENFVKSKNFYKDIEELCKADTARYALWVIGQDDFINSPYHSNDLKLITEARDTREEYPNDDTVADALATVAGNKDSINSPYHEEDMKLISESSSDCLRSMGSGEENGLNNLAINKVSLKDPYHLENMKILAKCPLTSEELYKIMTNPDIVNGKYYRDEVKALLNAKNKYNAKAIYYYVANPPERFINYIDFIRDDTLNAGDYINLIDGDRVSGNKNPNYLENLKIINKLPSEIAIHYTSLLMNKEFLNNPYSKEDLELLQTIFDKNLFLDLYKYIIEYVSVENPFHKSDVELLCKASNIETRRVLLDKMFQSLGEKNRAYDLDYIFKLNIDECDKNCLSAINYYLFDFDGITDPDHINSLEKLKQGKYYEIDLNKNTRVLNCIDTLEKELTETDKEIIKSKSLDLESNIDQKEKSLVLSLFKKFSKK